MNINASLFGQAITFAILIWFTMKYIWPPVTAALAERARKIGEGLAAAERGKRDLELAAKRSAEVIKEARQKASEIIAQAEKRNAEIVEEAKGAAKVAGDRLVAGAQAEIEREVQRAKETLRQQVADLAVAGAEKILRREIDRQAHGELLATLKNEL